MSSKRRLAHSVMIAIVLALNSSVPSIIATDMMRPAWLRELWQGVPLSVWAGIALIVLLIAATWIYSHSTSAGGPTSGKQG